METLLIDEELKKEFETEWELDCFNSDNPNVSRYEESQESCVPKSEHLNILSSCFGHKKFRPLQWKIINSIISKKRDNCAIMTTGYGKSLCYQFPAVYMGGLALVVSPLISLMEDQVLAMQISNISACLLGTANNKQKQTIDEIFQNQYSLIYLTPEFCTGDYGKDLLKKIHAELNVSLVAVDEAHCVSSWGHDFRFQYRHLGILKDIMPDVPILAVTATATQRVKEDIIKTLKLRNPQVTSSGFDRPNLYMSVHLKSSSILDDLRKVMERQNGQWKFRGATIIYCITRKQTEEISSLLNGIGVKSLPYHAGLSITVRNETHENFVKDKVDVIVATIAFGMGIDKPDIRNIVHYGASKSIEGYYQEIGRAGRDGLPAVCTAFYGNKDFITHRFLSEKSIGSSEGKYKMLDTMRDYLSTTKCRREFILSYFEDKKVISNGRCCDNCSENRLDSTTYEGLDSDGTYDFTEDAECFLKAVNALKGKFGINMYVLFLRGSKMTRLKNYINHPLHGSGKSKSEAWWKGIAILLEKEKYLKKIQNPYSSSNFASTTCVSEKGELFLRNDKKLLLPPIPELLQCLKTKSNTWLSSSNQLEPSTSTSTITNPKEDKVKESIMKLYQLLMNKRYELATLHDCMPFTIASNSALIEMAKQKPITLEQLRKCQLEGFTETKISKFGEEFIKTVRLALNISNNQCVEKMSIQDILIRHPLVGMKQSVSAQMTYSLFKSGLTIDEISQKRCFSLSTIISHLLDVMKLGYPIKLTELGVDNKIKNIIEDAVKKVDTGLSLLTPIKNVCPPDITYFQIKAVVTFLQIRQHIKNLNVPFVEFDDIDSVLDTPIPNTSKCEPATSNSDKDVQNLSQPTQNLKGLIQIFDDLEETPSGEFKEEDNSMFSDGFDDAILSAVCDKLETSLNEQEGELNNITTDNSCVQIGTAKTEEVTGFDFSLLDSPPRQTKTQEKRKVEETQTKISENNKKKKLPPWLMSQRIA